MIKLVAIFILLLACIRAPAQSMQQQAADIAAPAVHSAYKNDSANRMLNEIEREEWANAHSGEPPPPVTTPAPPAKPQVKVEPPQPRVTNLVSRAVTTRFLFLKISDSLLRFHVDANLGDSELEVVVNALTKSCLKDSSSDPTCDSAKQNSVLVDKAFLADAKLSQTENWSREDTPKGQNWKLVCASGGDDCFERATKVRAFRLTTNRGVLNGRILAHGFESQAVRAIAKKRRTPASVPQAKTLTRVYMTRTTSEKIPLLPKGTL